MRFNPDIHHRQSIRLRGYDYTQPGAYFITICTHQRQPLFGSIADGVMVLNGAGKVVEKCWLEISQHYPNIELGEHVVMPNHFHGIVHVGAGPRACPDDRGQPRGVAPTVSFSLPDVVHRFKSFTTRQYANGAIKNVWPSFNGRLWQRNYYEQIIRNDDAYSLMAEYIRTNPVQWRHDAYFD